MNQLLLPLVATCALVGADPPPPPRAPKPRRVHYVAPQYPSVARRASPTIMGIVALNVTLNEEGRPVNIEVLRGMPLLNEAAIDAAKQWRYEPTTIEGKLRKVVVLEVLDVFPEDRLKASYFASMLRDKGEPRVYRLLAIQRLKVAGTDEEVALAALQGATSDEDEGVRTAAIAALKDLGVAVN